MCERSDTGPAPCHGTVSAMMVVLLTKTRETKEILYHKYQILLSIEKLHKNYWFSLEHICVWLRERHERIMIYSSFCAKPLGSRTVARRIPLICFIQEVW